MKGIITFVSMSAIMIIASVTLYKNTISVLFPGAFDPEYPLVQVIEASSNREHGDTLAEVVESLSQETVEASVIIRNGRKILDFTSDSTLEVELPESAMTNLKYCSGTIVELHSHIIVDAPFSNSDLCTREFKGSAQPFIVKIVVSSSHVYTMRPKDTGAWPSNADVNAFFKTIIEQHSDEGYVNELDEGFVSTTKLMERFAEEFDMVYEEYTIAEYLEHLKKASF